MNSREKNSVVFIRIHSGECLFEALAEACAKHRVKSAAVLSGIGMLECFELAFIKGKGNYAKQLFKKPHELLCLNGIVLKNEKNFDFHLHAVLANEKKKTVGGHLVKGRVKVTGEIVLLKSNALLERKLDPETGLMALVP